MTRALCLTLSPLGNKKTPPKRRCVGKEKWSWVSMSSPLELIDVHMCTHTLRLQMCVRWFHTPVNSLLLLSLTLALPYFPLRHTSLCPFPPYGYLIRHHRSDTSSVFSMFIWTAFSVLFLQLHFNTQIQSYHNKQHQSRKEHPAQENRARISVQLIFQIK